MAKLYKKKSDLQKKEKDLRRKTLMGAFLFVLSLLAVLGGFYNVDGNARIIIWTVGCIGIFFGIFLTRYYYQKFCIIHSGVLGEKKAQKFIRGLPRGYRVISNLKVCFKGQSAEMDLVVIGENGIFVIETKNHNGTIKGTIEDKNWCQYKTGRGGGHYQKEFYNPTKQVATHVYVLSKFLKSKGIDVWVQGLVYFANSEARVQVKTDIGHPLFAASYNGEQELINYICTYHNERQFGKDKMKRVAEVLSKS